MQIQHLTRADGVTGRYVPGVGATPVLRTSRVGSAALVAPTPGTSTIHNISAADTERIRAPSETHRRSILGRFIDKPNFTHRRYS